MPVSDNSTTASNAAGKVAKIVFLSLFALVLVVVSVSFAVHHMRLGFEKEFQNTLIRRVQTDAVNAASAVSGGFCQGCTEVRRRPSLYDA